MAQHLSEETIAELVEGTLTGDRLAQAEAHLATCETCLRLVSEVGGAATHETASVAQAASADDDGEPPLLARDTQVGRYVVIEPVGSGAMGRVYAAHDPALDRKVALKLLHPRVADADLEARLLREAKAMARLTHPEVITVHDAGRHGKQLFIAMEFVDGGTLRQWLTSKRRSWREVLAVFLRAGRGLAQAHAAGIVHRDFKPDNVLVGRDGRVRVTDFGLARGVHGDDGPEPAHETSASGSLDETLTRTGAIVGTPAYMAPEQLAGKGADVRSDVYAFCTALYEGLYGERPFASKSILALQAEKIEGKPHAPKDDRGVPMRVRRALLAGLRPRPEDRWASMDDLLAALERASRAPRGPLAIGAAIAVAGVAAIAFAARGAHGPPPPPAAASAPGCSSDRACVEAHGGAPWRCRASDRACVAIASEDCAPMFEPSDLAAEGTVWLGAMFPTKGPNAKAFGAMNMDGADLARREIAEATSALAGSNAALRVRRVALVGCDDSDDPMRAAHHLVDDVGVPAILGFASGKEVEDVAGSLLIDRGVLTMATLTTSPLITRLPQPLGPRMVWRTSHSFDAAAEATAHFLHDVIEPRGPQGEARVTFARVDTRGGEWFGEALYRRLVFNGKPAVDNGAAYREIKFAGDAPAEEMRRVADRVLDAPPTILLLLGDVEPTLAVIERVEASWPARTPRPTYVIANGSIDGYAPFLGKSVDRRRRLFGVMTVTAQTANARFLMRFEAAHPGEGSRVINPGVTYDAFYALAYAAFALGDAPVTGEGLARSIARLVPPGTKIETGPSGVFEALTTLAKGQNVDLEGPSGPLDFDLATGEMPSDFELLCAGVDRAGRAANDIDSGLVFKMATRTVEGTMRCP